MKFYSFLKSANLSSQQQECQRESNVSLVDVEAHGSRQPHDFDMNYMKRSRKFLLSGNNRKVLFPLYGASASELRLLYAPTGVLILCLRPAQEE